MGERTPLYDLHLALGAKMIDFSGWEMPLHYGSQVEEHHQVRRECGVFDVSHLCVVDVTGAQAQAFLRRLLANDVARLDAPGSALYSVVLNEQGGIVDDLLVYLTVDGYRLVSNAATRQRLASWLRQQAASFAVQLRERSDLAILAVQGPDARARDGLEAVMNPRRGLHLALAEEAWLPGPPGRVFKPAAQIDVDPGQSHHVVWRVALHQLARSRAAERRMACSAPTCRAASYVSETVG